MKKKRQMAKVKFIFVLANISPVYDIFANFDYVIQNECLYPTVTIT